MVVIGSVGLRLFLVFLSTKPYGRWDSSGFVGILVVVTFFLSYDPHHDNYGRPGAPEDGATARRL